jgi:hypothetical protein
MDPPENLFTEGIYELPGIQLFSPEISGTHLSGLDKKG